jgi:hypothetical protein
MSALRDQVADLIHLRHCDLWIEEAYTHWINEFIFCTNLACFDLGFNESVPHQIRHEADGPFTDALSEPRKKG